MKGKRFLCVVMAFSMFVVGIMSYNPNVYAHAWGDWEETSDGWKFKKSNGEYACTEFINGWWMNENGIKTGELCDWQNDGEGLAWYGDSSGWYACGALYKIDGEYYRFDSDGYLIQGWQEYPGGWRCNSQKSPNRFESDQWIDGYWLDENGYWTYKHKAQWYHDSKGWYYMDSSGYYEKNKTVRIDGTPYTFDENGYVVEYTQVMYNPDKTTKIEYEFNEVNTEFFEKLLNYYFINNKQCIVNGKKVRITKKNEQIYLANKSLEKFFSSYVGKIELSFESKNISFPLFGFRDDNKCKYKVKLCGVVFSDIYYVNDKCSFKVNNKKYSTTLNQLGVLRLEGDVRKVDWIKKLKKAGRVKVDNDLVY